MNIVTRVRRAALGTYSPTVHQDLEVGKIPAWMESKSGC